MAPIVTGLNAVHFGSHHKKEAPISGMAQPKKHKKRKRKAQVPSSEDDDPPPDQAINDTAQPEKLIISVDQRAWDTFHGALFFVPDVKKMPSELRWKDFLHAMAELGSSASNNLEWLRGAQETRASIRWRQLHVLGSQTYGCSGLAWVSAVMISRFSPRPFIQ